MIPLFQRTVRVLDNAYLTWQKEQNDARMRATRDAAVKPANG
jgi:hypothetical protein